MCCKLLSGNETLSSSKPQQALSLYAADEPFTEEFKKGVKQMTRSEVRFGFVERKHWGYPEWIDQNKAAETRKQMKEKVSAANRITNSHESLRRDLWNFSP